MATRPQAGPREPTHSHEFRFSVKRSFANNAARRAISLLQNFGRIAVKNLEGGKNHEALTFIGRIRKILPQAFPGFVLG